MIPLSEDESQMNSLEVYKPFSSEKEIVQLI